MFDNNYLTVKLTSKDLVISNYESVQSVYDGYLKTGSLSDVHKLLSSIKVSKPEGSMVYNIFRNIVCNDIIHNISSENYEMLNKLMDMNFICLIELRRLHVCPNTYVSFFLNFPSFRKFIEELNLNGIKFLYKLGKNYPIYDYKNDITIGLNFLLFYLLKNKLFKTSHQYRQVLKNFLGEEIFYIKNYICIGNCTQFKSSS